VFCTDMPGAAAGCTMWSLEKRSPFMRASCPGRHPSAKITDVLVRQQLAADAHHFGSKPSLGFRTLHTAP
jgi:hypothetical protein